MSKTVLPTESIETYLIRRRALMRLGAMAGLGAALPGLRARAQAKPATPLQFVGWQYNPQIVAQNVETFEQLYDENVNYQLIPGEYAPITETMLVAGKKFDMMYSEEATLARWIAAGWAQDVDSMPDVAAIKASMVPVGVRNLSLPNGKLGGLPYYAGYGSFIYNEKHLDQAKLQPPTSWAEFLEQARQLKKDKIVEFPYVSAWAHQAPSFSWSLFSIWYSEGAKVFDANFDPVFDDKFTGVLEMHRTLYREGLVSPDIFTLPQEGVPSFATGQHTFAVIHDYDQKVLNDPKLSQCAGQVRNAIMPGRGAFHLLLGVDVSDGRRHGRSGSRLESVALLWRQGEGRAVPCDQALGAAVRPRDALYRGDERSRGRGLVQELEEYGYRPPAAAEFDTARCRQDAVVPGLGLVHDGRGSGLHPRQSTHFGTGRRPA